MIASVLGIYILDILCPVRYIFQIPCPTCGMTRAWFAFLNGNISVAFYFHPLFLLGPIIVLLVIFYDRYRNNHFYNISLITIGVLFFIVYLIRFNQIP